MSCNIPSNTTSTWYNRSQFLARSETESITIHIAKVICHEFPGPTHPDGASAARYPLQIVDLCSGTGCISLLLHALLAPRFDHLSILGIDIHPKAIRLAKDNLLHNFRLGRLSKRAIAEIQYCRGDILCRQGQFPGIDDCLLTYFRSPQGSKESLDVEERRVDVLVANPPYISAESFHDGTTARSVRIFEPTLALVPPVWSPPPMTGFYEEDLFYRDIVLLSLKLRPRLVVFECGDREQAARVSAAFVTFATCHGESLPIISSQIWPSEAGDEVASPLSESEACAVFLHMQS